jgi:hypothetical protein
VFAYVVCRGERPQAEARALTEELRQWVAQQLSPIAKPDEIRFADALPKTRSGKIMRRLLRAIARGEEILQDVSTLENPAIVAQLHGEERAGAPKPGGDKTIARKAATKNDAPRKAAGKTASSKTAARKAAARKAAAKKSARRKIVVTKRAKKAPAVKRGAKRLTRRTARARRRGRRSAR